MQLDINDHEKKLLQDLLEKHIWDLRMEINRTDDLDYKSKLAERKESLDKILTTLH